MFQDIEWSNNAKSFNCKPNHTVGIIYLGTTFPDDFPHTYANGCTVYIYSLLYLSCIARVVYIYRLPGYMFTPHWSIPFTVHVLGSRGENYPCLLVSKLLEFCQRSVSDFLKRMWTSLAPNDKKNVLSKSLWIDITWLCFANSSDY